jgi:hypothetical protein
MVTGTTIFLLILPWLVWIEETGGEQRSQVELLFAGSFDLVARVREQATFYGQRIPDQICGPVVEYATIIRRGKGWENAANLWAAGATAVVLAGWACSLLQARRRLAGLIALSTLAILLIWPYTEAGRFLVPLVPCLLIGAVEGLSRLLAWIGHLSGRRPLERRARFLAAMVILALSLPYTSYCWLSGRARRPDPAQQAFDSACVWLKQNGDRPGRVLTRHPGEVFLATGRQALEVSTAERSGDYDAGPPAVASAIGLFRVAYLLIDDDRYLNAHPSPLSRFVLAHPERVRKIGEWPAERSSVVIYEVVPEP